MSPMPERALPAVSIACWMAFRHSLLVPGALSRTVGWRATPVTARGG